MKRITSCYNKDAWTQTENDEGNVIVSTIKGTPVCEIQHPVLIGEQILPSAMLEFKANVMLIQHSNAVAEQLERVYESLIALKQGKTTVFDFELDKIIKETEITLIRATKID